MNKANRQSIVDLWRFIGCLLIMSFHLYFTGISIEPYPFYTAWIYVEFFLILSGYYTASHFDIKETVSPDNMAKEAIRYTVKKYIRFLPYVIIATSVYYFIDYFLIGFSITTFINFLFDTTLLTGSFYEAYLPVRPLWFLSVMFIVFPIFCFFCQIKSKHILYMIAFYIPLIYYGYTPRPSLAYFPYHIPRALAALFLGVLVYAICSYIRKIHFSFVKKVLLTCVEIVALWSVVYFTYIGKLEYYRFFILCFAVGLIIMLSGQSYTMNINSIIFRWLGRMSMPMYILHTTIAHYISTFCAGFSSTTKIISYYGGTLLISAVCYYFVETIRNKRVGGGKSL